MLSARVSEFLFSFHMFFFVSSILNLSFYLRWFVCLAQATMDVGNVTRPVEEIQFTGDEVSLNEDAFVARQFGPELRANLQKSPQATMSLNPVESDCWHVVSTITRLDFFDSSFGLLVATGAYLSGVGHGKGPGFGENILPVDDHYEVDMPKDPLHMEIGAREKAHAHRNGQKTARHADRIIEGIIGMQANVGTENSGTTGHHEEGLNFVFLFIIVCVCRHILRTLVDVKVRVIQRTANRTAHILGRAVGSSGLHEWGYFPPLCIKAILASILMH